MNEPHIRGVLAPAVTPFDKNLQPDSGRFREHCAWLLRSGCHALAVFGTTGEANSLSVRERMTLLDELISSGIESPRLLAGTGCCALTDTAQLTAHAVQAGCAGVLMLPPFYYKSVSDEGLFRAFAQTIERVGDNRLRIYLYHIPPVANIGFSPELIRRLIEAYPGIIVGLKDSSGDWQHTKRLIAYFPGFSVFSGNELSLVDNLRHGGSGCITATANINCSAIRNLFDSWRCEEADILQRRINETRKAVSEYAMIPALKGVISVMMGDRQWSTVRPPLVELSNDDIAALVGTLTTQGVALARVTDSG